MPNVECPKCGQALEVEAGSGSVVTCPMCQGRFNWRGGPAAGTQPSAAAATWHLRTPDGQRYGPTAEGEIVTWIRQGSVPYGSMVWRQGMAAWALVEATEPFSTYAYALTQPGARAPRPVVPQVMTRPPWAPRGSWSGAAVTGFVLSLSLGWFCLLGPLLAIVFCGIGISATSPGSGRRGRGLAVAGLAIGLLVLVVTVILLAVGAAEDPSLLK